MLAPSHGGKFNHQKSLFLVGAQCLRPPEGASIAPLQMNGWMIYILQSPYNENILKGREISIIRTDRLLELPFFSPTSTHTNSSTESH